MSRFLDKDSSGVIDVTEVDKAVREFRQLSRDMPSIGTGPMTVIDLSEVERLAKRSFSDMVASRGGSHRGPNAEFGAGGEAETTLQSSGGGRNPGVESTDDGQVQTAAVDTKTPPDENRKGRVGAGQEIEARKEDGAGEDRGGRVEAGGEGIAAVTVSVSEISTAFEEAFRQFKDSASKEDSAGARWYPAAQHPLADAQYEQVSVLLENGWTRFSMCKNEKKNRLELHPTFFGDQITCY